MEFRKRRLAGAAGASVKRYLQRLTMRLHFRLFGGLKKLSKKASKHRDYA